MAFPVYSHRIFYLKGANQATTFQVPEDMRAVITSITAVSAGAGAAAVWLGVHGIVCWGWSTQVQFSQVSAALRLVAYERETFSLAIEGLDTRAVASGYVFQDPGNSWRPPAPVVLEAPDHLPYLGPK